jgi:LuxR family maltose regulon positive regulatory protein
VVTPESKVRRPAARRGQVLRQRVLRDLRESNSELVLVLAPAGFGKTILISQWAASTGRPVAWATVNGRDADPVVLMSTILAALATGGVKVVPPPGTMTADEPAYSRRVLPQFQRSLEQLDGPVTLVVDDVHDMAGVRAAVVLSAVLESLPAGSQLALVGRSRPDLPVALWRSQGRVYELGSEDLAFDAAEIRALLGQLAAVEPTTELVDEILRTTAGWPVAAYLQGLATTFGHQPPDRPSAALIDYLDSVVMAGAAPELVEFLTRSSILATLSPSSCDYVLGITDSRSFLHAAEGATLLVNRLEGADGYYRLHPLLRERLAQELAASDPGVEKALHARAARWCDDQGYVEEGMAHGALSGDLDLFGSLVWARAPGALIVGRHSAVQGWLALVDESAVAQSPALSITQACSAVLRADGAAAIRWAQVTADLLGPDWQEHLDRSTVEPSLALLLALPGRAGFQASATLAQASHTSLPATHPLRPLAQLIHGAYLVLDGEINEGRAVIEHSRDLAQSLRLGTTWVGSSTMLAALDIQADNWAAAEESIRVARRVWLEYELDDFSTTAWMSSVSGLLHARHGEERQARADLRRAEAILSSLGPLLPWLHVLMQSMVARAWAMLGDADAAVRAEEAGRTVRLQLPESTFLDGLIGSARQAIGRSEVLGRLTPAELRLWPHLLERSTLREIAAQLQLSPETVKTEVRSIYRKAGVSSRRELQDLADRLGDAARPGAGSLR